MQEQPINQREQILSTFEVAHELGISPPTVRELAKSGQLRARRIGKLFKVTRADLDTFKQTCEARARAA